MRRKDELTSKFAVTNKEQDHLKVSIIQLQRELNAVSNKLEESIVRRERKQKQHQEILAETCREMEQSLETINDNREEMKLEIKRIKENIEEESR